MNTAFARRGLVSVVVVLLAVLLCVGPELAASAPSTLDGIAVSASAHSLLTAATVHARHIMRAVMRPETVTRLDAAHAIQRPPAPLMGTRARHVVPLIPASVKPTLDRSSPDPTEDH